MLLINMAKSKFLKIRTNRLAMYIFILIGILLTILVITLLVPVVDDPPIYHYPFMVYLPLSLTLNFLLYLIAGILLRKSEGKFKDKSANWGILLTLFNRVEWEENIPSWRRIFRYLTLMTFIIGTVGFLIIGIVAPDHIISPMNMLFLPFVLSMITAWIVLGLKQENVIIALILFILLGIYMSLVVGAFIIGQDAHIPLVLLAISGPILALILISVRLLSYIFIERKF